MLRTARCASIVAHSFAVDGQITSHSLSRGAPARFVATTRKRTRCDDEMRSTQHSNRHDEHSLLACTACIAVLLIDY
jgi:hypothetical protein